MAGRETGTAGMGAVAAVPAVDLAQITAMAAAHHLAVLGGFACDGEAGLPAGTRTVLMLGPAEPGYWAHVRAQPEWGGVDPVDRWSRRVIGGMACDLGAKALFPFGGPPYHPFYQWALRTGRGWGSPPRRLGGGGQGGMVSVCGGGGLRGAGYDVRACRGFLDSAAGADCMNFGCAVRRACPLSAAYARLPEKSPYHIGQVHKRNG